MSISVKTHDLTKKYGKFTAVNQVSLTVNDGDIYGLVGKNGSGKTTLFKMIMGLTEPQEGEISIEGSQTSLELNRSRKNIGFMIGSTFFPYLNARENIEYYRQLKGITDVKETDRVLKMVQLDGVNKTYKKYSMGMKQRLSIANAMLGHPDIIILDEPTNGLDPQGIVEFREIIRSLNREYKTTFIISSHILSELGLVATRFGFINQGTLIQEISREELEIQTQNALVIAVDDVVKATMLLENELMTTNFTINGKNEIVLQDYLKEPARVSRVLVENGVELFKLQRFESTLEDYFISLVGGESHV